MYGSDQVARRIKEIRRRLNLTAEEVALRCREAGGTEITAAVIANIETGRRDATKRRRRLVSIDEIPIFARALGVPPLALLYPIETNEDTEVLPGVSLPAWDAAEWFTGEAPLRGPGCTLDSAELNIWHMGAASVDLRRRHEAAYSAWQLAYGSDDAGARDAEQDLRHVRREMRQIGMTLPDLPDPLIHLDQLPTR